MRCGARTIRGSSRPATAATAIRSPSPMASAGTCSAVRVWAPRRSWRPSRSSLSLFKEYGLPLRIRTDNGVPFATTTLARLSKLSAWWVRLGILPEFIEPGRPDQNGRHERMHRTLTAATRPAAGSLGAQPRRFNGFREEFNHERPHEALDQQTRRRGPCQTGCPRSNIPIASRCATSAPTAAFGGIAAGSTSPRCAWASTSASRRSTPASGMCTSGPCGSAGCSSGTCASRMRMGD